MGKLLCEYEGAPVELDDETDDYVDITFDGFPYRISRKGTFVGATRYYGDYEFDSLSVDLHDGYSEYFWGLDGDFAAPISFVYPKVTEVLSSPDLMRAATSYQAELGEVDYGDFGELLRRYKIICKGVIDPGYLYVESFFFDCDIVRVGNNPVVPKGSVIKRDMGGYSLVASDGLLYADFGGGAMLPLVYCEATGGYDGCIDIQRPYGSVDRFGFIVPKNQN